MKIHEAEAERGKSQRWGGAIDRGGDVKKRKGAIKRTNEWRGEQGSTLFHFILVFLNAGEVAEPGFPPSTQAIFLA